MKSDPQEIIRAARLIVGHGNVTELRALDAVLAGDRYPGTLSGYFNDFEKLAEAACSIKSAKGIYIIANQVNPALLARAENHLRRMAKGDASTSDNDILQRNWLLIDADAVRPSGISATEMEHEAAIQRCRDIFAFLKARGWPDPIAADSGNGGHLLYRIDLPADEGGLVQHCLNALADRFDDEVVKVDRTVHNPARIWKMYGTLACKGDSTPDRPHRTSAIIHAPAELHPVPMELLEALAAEAKQAEPVRAAPANVHTGGNRQRFDLKDWIARYLPDAQGPEKWNDGERWVLPTCPFNPAYTDGAAYIVQHANGAIAGGCHHNGCSGKAWRDLRAIFEPRSMSTSPSSGRSSRPCPAMPLGFQPFPVDAMPEPIRRFVKVCAAALGCDPSYVALPLLAGLASAVGNTRRIRLKNNWTEPAILWCIIVGWSGTVKSPAIDTPLRAIRTRQAKAFKQHKADMVGYEKAMEKYNNEKKQRKKDGESSDDLERPEKPVCERQWVSDVTIEALADRLSDAPRGLLVARDELAAWLNSFGQYKAGRGGDDAHWLELHRAGNLMVDRKTGDKTTIHVPRAAVCLTGGIQPETLRRALGREHFESGMAARMFLAMPPRKTRKWTDADVPDELHAALAGVFDQLYSMKFSTDAHGEVYPADVMLTPDAMARFIEYFNAHNAEQVELINDEAAAWSKLEGGAARLALVIHCTRWAAGDKTLGDPFGCDLQSMEVGIALATWFKGEARRVYAVLGESDDDREHRRLVEVIERKGGRVTVNDLTHSLRQYRGKVDEARAALNHLVEAGYGRWTHPTPGPQGGRPSESFQLTNSVTVTETTTDDSVNGSFSDGDSNRDSDPVSADLDLPPGDDADLAGPLPDINDRVGGEL